MDEKDTVFSAGRFLVMPCYDVPAFSEDFLACLEHTVLFTVTTTDIHHAVPTTVLDERDTHDRHAAPSTCCVRVHATTHHSRRAAAVKPPPCIANEAAKCSRRRKRKEKPRMNFHSPSSDTPQKQVAQRVCAQAKTCIVLRSAINYELFNSSNVSIGCRSWNYRGCWHQTCPPIETHCCIYLWHPLQNTARHKGQTVLSFLVAASLFIVPVVGNLRACCPP